MKVKIESGLKVLMVNDKIPCQCPYKMPLPTNIVTSAGAMQAMAYAPCTSQCPHFSIINVDLSKGKTKVINLTCGTESLIEIENPELLETSN